MSEEKEHNDTAFAVNNFELRIIGLSGVPTCWCNESGADPYFQDHIFRYEVDILTETDQPWQLKTSFLNGRLCSIDPANKQILNSYCKQGQADSERERNGIPISKKKVDPIQLFSNESRTKELMVCWCLQDSNTSGDSLKDDTKNAKKETKKISSTKTVNDAEIKEIEKPQFQDTFIYSKDLSEQDVSNLQSMCEQGAHLRVHFRRILRPGCPPEWEDLNESKYRAESNIELSLFNEPGTKKITLEVPLSQALENNAEDNEKRSKKAAGKKVKGSVPTPLLPEEFESEHPYSTFKTCLEVSISFSHPLVKLPQDRPCTETLPKDIIPRKIRALTHNKGLNDELEEALSESTSIIIEVLQEFTKKTGLAIEEDNTRREFLQYLTSEGLSANVKNRLKPIIRRLIRDCLNSQLTSNCSIHYQEVYSRLIHEVHRTIHKYIYTVMPRYVPKSLQGELNWWTLAEEAEFTKDFELASFYYQEAISNSSNEEQLVSRWHLYGRFCLRIREKEQAIQALREALSYEIEHRPSLLDLGLVHLSENNFKEAEVFIQAVLNLDMDNGLNWMSLALFYEKFKYNRQDERILECERVYCISQAQRKGDLESLYFDIAEHLVKMRLEDLALVPLKNVVTRSTDLIFARLETQTMQYSEAIYRLENYIASCNEEDFAAIIQLGFAFMCAEKYVEAESWLRKAIRVDSQNVPNRAYVWLGNMYLSQGRYVEARDVFITSAKCNNNSLAWMGLGIAHFRMDDIHHAEQAFNESNLINYRNPRTWAFISLCCFKTMRFSEAKVALRHSLKLNLKEVDLIIELGLVAQEYNFLSESTELLNRAAKLSNTSKTYLILTRNLCARGMYESALCVLEKALKLSTEESERAILVKHREALLKKIDRTC